MARVFEQPRSFVGSRYEETRTLDIREIAKLVRAEVKAAFPDKKTSIRIERYAGGQSLHVRMIDCDPAFVSAEGRSARTELNRIAQQYNFDFSDVEQDYFHVRFFVEVEVQGPRDPVSG